MHAQVAFDQRRIAIADPDGSCCQVRCGRLRGAILGRRLHGRDMPRRGPGQADQKAGQNPAWPVRRSVRRCVGPQPWHYTAPIIASSKAARENASAASNIEHPHLLCFRGCLFNEHVRLLPRLVNPLTCHGPVFRVDFDAGAKPAQLLAGDERGSAAHEGV